MCTFTLNAHIVRVVLVARLLVSVACGSKPEPRAQPPPNGNSSGSINVGPAPLHQ